MTEDQFWLNTDRSGECWLWTRSTTPTGYGHLGWKGKTVAAHRVAWELARGPIPDGLWVLHNCPGGDNPRCVNPDHLWLGTVLDNNRDSRRKGRAAPSPFLDPAKRPKGEQHKNSKLTLAAVQEIRRRYAEGGVTQEALGQEYGVTFSQISMVVLRKSWAHV